jgi:D-alanyl-D-alanine carboxypeptidase/D-alanyl-D-alanine-endopeptidase (penicillin-binding protein 4)
MRSFALLLLVPCLVEAQPLAERIQALERRHPAMLRAYWGAQVVDLETGATLLDYNARRLFVPASNAKLFSTALALRRLGPDHRFITVIQADREPGEDGVLEGDLRLVGGGDPTMSDRKIPYEKGAGRGEPFAALEELVDLATARPLRAIEGAVVGDDSAYWNEPYPPGWSVDDLTWDYGAPVSALSLHDNAFRLVVRGGPQPGEPAWINLAPPLDLYAVENGVATVAANAAGVVLHWPPDARRIEVRGSLRPGQAREFSLAVRHPALHAASVLDSILRRRGITVRDPPRARHRAAEAGEPAAAPGGVELARRTSPPLYEILKIINKDSQNLYAELVLREVGRVRRQAGSRQAGLEELGSFLRQVGISPEQYQLHDGSGLSRLNLVSPEAVVKLLTHMYFSEDRDGWLETLPIGGEDGTLSHRFRGSALANRVFAKTGTLTHVSALSGYLETAPGTHLAFSVLVNNSGVPAAVARRFIDELVGILSEWRRPAQVEAPAQEALP